MLNSENIKLDAILSFDGISNHFLNKNNSKQMHTTAYLRGVRHSEVRRLQVKGLRVIQEQGSKSDCRISP